MTSFIGQGVLIAFLCFSLSASCSLVRAQEPELVLESCSLSDQTAVVTLAGTSILAEAGKVIDSATNLKLVKVLPQRVEFAMSDPKAPMQWVRLWFDISKGVETATLRRVSSDPGEVPEIPHFDPPQMIPIDSDEAAKILKTLPTKEN